MDEVRGVWNPVRRGMGPFREGCGEGWNEPGHIHAGTNAVWMGTNPPHPAEDRLQREINPPAASVLDFAKNPTRAQ